MNEGKNDQKIDTCFFVLQEIHEEILKLYEEKKVSAFSVGEIMHCIIYVTMYFLSLSGSRGIRKYKILSKRGHTFFFINSSL